MLQSIVNSLSALAFSLAALAGGLFLMRRRPATFAVLTTLTLTLVLALPGSAMETRRSRGQTTVASGETIDDTLLVFGETVSIDGTVTGDLITFARRVAIKGTVKGEVICFAQNLDVDGTVEGNVHSFVQLLDIRGHVGRNIHAFAQRVLLDRGGRVDGDILAFSSESNLEGGVGRDVTAFAASVDVRGNIGRNLVVRSDRLTLSAPARIGGNVTARVSRKERVQIDSGATVAGKTEIEVPEREPTRFATLRFYLWEAVKLVAAFLTGLLLFWLFPILFGARLDTAGALLRTAGLGFLVVVVTPVAAIIAAITLIGLPIGLLSLGFWIAALYLAKIFVAIFLGQSILERPAMQAGWFALALLVGLVIVFVAINIPYVGGWIHFLMILLGIGAMTSQIYRHWNRTESAS